MISLNFIYREKAINYLLDNPFVNSLNENDIKYRLKKKLKINDYKTIITNSVMEFSKEEENIVLNSFDFINKRLEKMNLSVNLNIDVIKTNGSENLYKSYSIDNALIFSESDLKNIQNENLNLLVSSLLYYVFCRNYRNFKTFFYNYLKFTILDYEFFKEDVIKNIIHLPNSDYMFYFVMGEKKVRPVIVLANKNELKEIYYEFDEEYNYSCITDRRIINRIKDRKKDYLFFSEYYNPYEIGASIFSRILVNNENIIKDFDRNFKINLNN